MKNGKCPAGEYYCYTNKECKPIPKGFMVDPEGMLRKENGASTTKEEWSQKYKKSIDCDNPKGFSQKAHCQGRKKKMKSIKEEGLRDWFGKSKSKDGKKGWVNVVTGDSCASDKPGEGIPKCVSSAKRASMSKKERLAAAAAKRREDPGQQKKTGASKPTNVKTDRKTRKESIELVDAYGETFATIQDIIKPEPMKETVCPRCGQNPCVCSDTYDIESMTEQQYMTKKKMKEGVEDINAGGRRDAMKDALNDMKNTKYDPTAGKKRGKRLLDRLLGIPPVAEENVTEAKDKKGKGSGTKDACYHKVKSRYSVWPSAYASGALVKCRKVGAANWGNKTKKEEFEFSPSQVMALEAAGLIQLNEKGQKCWKGYEKKGTKKMFGKTYNNCVKKEEFVAEEESDRRKDERQERGGVDGNTDYKRPAKNNTKKFGTGKTAMQKEMEKKHGKGKSAMEIVTAEIRAKHKKKKKEEDKKENTNEERIRINQNGHTYSVMLNWRGKTYSIQIFFPELRKPTRQEVEDKIRKIYPDAKVTYFAPKEFDPADPTVMVGEQIQPGKPGDGFIGPTIGGYGIPNPIRIAHDASDIQVRRLRKKVNDANEAGRGHINFKQTGQKTHNPSTSDAYNKFFGKPRPEYAKDSFEPEGEIVEGRGDGGSPYEPYKAPKEDPKNPYVPAPPRQKPTKLATKTSKTISSHYQPEGEVIDERTMTDGEMQKEKKLRKKYDKGDMKKSMKDQYGEEEGKKIYFAKIRKIAMGEGKYSSSVRATYGGKTETFPVEVYKKKSKKTKVAEGKGDPCWDTHKQVGMKKKGGKMVPNCVPKEEVELSEAPFERPPTGAGRATSTPPKGVPHADDPHVFPSGDVIKPGTDITPLFDAGQKQNQKRRMNTINRIIKGNPKNWDFSQQNVDRRMMSGESVELDKKPPSKKLRPARPFPQPSEPRPPRPPGPGHKEPLPPFDDPLALSRKSVREDWQKKSGKNPEGGLNEKGRKSYERENPGSDLKAPTKKKGNPRRASFCARMKGMKKKLTSKKTANDPDSRINKSLRKWDC